MIPNDKFDKIFNMLLKGVYTTNYIATKQGVSAKTVNGIASGRIKRARPNRNTAEQLRYPKLAGGQFERCPGCGGKVQMPCYGCSMRAARERDKAMRAS